MSGYTEGIIILLCINAIAAMGVSLLTGFTGIFSLGHAAYMAVGAYTTAILTVEYGVHYIPAILLGGAMAMIVAYVIGVPTLKLMGDYYAIASIGLGRNDKTYTGKLAVRNQGSKRLSWNRGIYNSLCISWILCGDGFRHVQSHSQPFRESLQSLS